MSWSWIYLTMFRRAYCWSVLAESFAILSRKLYLAIKNTGLSWSRLLRSNNIFLVGVCCKNLDWFLVMVFVSSLKLLDPCHVGSTEVTFRAYINTPSPSHQFPHPSTTFPMFYHLPSTGTCHYHHSCPYRLAYRPRDHTSYVHRGFWTLYDLWPDMPPHTRP